MKPAKIIGTSSYASSFCNVNGLRHIETFIGVLWEITKLVNANKCCNLSLFAYLALIIGPYTKLPQWDLKPGIFGTGPSMFLINVMQCSDLF